MQRGNALFLILIAVALFAALAYAVTQSSRDGGNANREMEILEVSRMIQYASTLEQTINRLLLTGGCTDTSLSFYSPQWVNAGFYINAYSVPDNSCDIFNTAGGNVTWQVPPPIIGALSTEYVIGGHYRFEGMGENGPPGGEEITLFSRVTQSMCTYINQQEGISPMPESTFATVPVVGTLPYTYGFNNLPIGPFFSGSVIGISHMGSDDTMLAGHRMGCFHAVGYYAFYYILLAR